MENTKQVVKAGVGLGTAGKKGLSHLGDLPSCSGVPGVPPSPCSSSHSRLCRHLLTKLQVLFILSSVDNNGEPTTLTSCGSDSLCCGLRNSYLHNMLFKNSQERFFFSFLNLIAPCPQQVEHIQVFGCKLMQLQARKYQKGVCLFSKINLILQ